LEDIRCPFCNQYLYHEEIASHLVRWHESSAVEHGHPLCFSRKAQAIICWCGLEVKLDDGKGSASMFSMAALLAPWTQHLEDHGGLEAHLLEVALGSQAD
jgi:hypothetical protein